MEKYTFFFVCRLTMTPYTNANVPVGTPHWGACKQSPMIHDNELLDWTVHMHMMKPNLLVKFI